MDSNLYSDQWPPFDLSDFWVDPPLVSESPNLAPSPWSVDSSWSWTETEEQITNSRTGIAQSFDEIHGGALFSPGEYKPSDLYSKAQDSHSHGIAVPCVPRKRAKSRQAGVNRGSPLIKGLRIGQVRADPDYLSDHVELVASGELSDVYRGSLLDGTHVAIKALRVSPIDKSLKHAARELHTWSKLSHPNVLPLLGLAEFPHRIAVVAPWLKNGNLQEYLGQKRVDRWQMCSQVAAGLEHLHKSGIVHGDIRAHNILVSDKGKPQISDFGLSKHLLPSIESSGFDSSRLRWLAPELIVRGEDSASASIEGDVYAFAMTILEVLTGKEPYDEYKSDVQVTMAIIQGTPPIRPSNIALTTKVGDERWSILTECWNNRPELRSSMPKVKRMRSKRPKTESNSLYLALRDANRASIYESRGELEKATDVRLRIQQRSQREFGNDAEQTISSHEALAHTYTQRSMFEAAATHQLEARNRRKRIYGASHPATVQSNYNLASIYAKQFKLSAAEELATQVWTQWSFAFGRDHAQTQQATRLLAGIRYKRNQRESFSLYLQQTQPDILDTGSLDALTSVAVQVCPTADLDDEIDRLVASGITRIACSSSHKHPKDDQGRSSMLRRTSTLDRLNLSGNWPTALIPKTQTLKDATKVRPCIGTQTSVEQGFKYLTDSGCRDVTSQLDALQLSEAPIAFSAYNDIWQGRLLGGGELVAIKCSRSCTDPDIQAKQTKRVIREAHVSLLLSDIRHPNVMEFLGIARFKNRIALVLRWMSHGTLMAYVLKNLGVDCWKLSQQVADGLSIIHSMGVVHGDLKAANVFVSDQGVPKIGDFGNTSPTGGYLDYTPTTNIGGGTARHMAPELLQEESERSAPADVYALAMTILNQDQEAMTRRRPYSEHAAEPYVTLLVTQGIPPRRPEELGNESKYGDERWAMINDCLRMDPQLRPTASEIQARVGVIFFLDECGAQDSPDARSALIGNATGIITDVCGYKKECIMLCD
ncbi:hypothetical protein FRC12_024212 [Ceratobasidium sp. 428]|nr:hypothetical protein FRC12_024212 [Ceratobasidium sp. 428]